MSKAIAESIVSKACGFFSNGNAATAFKVAGVIFLAGVLWAKVSALEAQVSTLTAQVNMQIADLTNQVNILVTHLLANPP